MPITTTRTTTVSTGVAVHTISFSGLAGGIFISLSVATVVYVMGFATTGWTINGGYHLGLWESCSCGKYNNPDDWLRAVEALATIGLIALLVAMIISAMYMCIHSISKNTTILALVIVCFIAAVFILLAVLVYGIKSPHHLNWSFACACIGCILCFVAGVLAFLQMRKSGV